MDVLNADQLSARIREFLAAPRPVLIAGAGVGQRAGLPGWVEYLNHLLGVTEEHDPAMAAVVRDRIESGALADAAEFYKRAKIPPNTIHRRLAEPFQPGRYTAHALRGLVSMPFSCIVTTNYDLSLHDAWSEIHGRSCLRAELDDDSLGAASFWTDMYIARIHGRAEMPPSMVVSSDDFKSLGNHRFYLQYLTNLFRFNRYLIIGFSFSDPPIRAILEYLKEIAIQGTVTTHTALLPNGQGSLAADLTNLNVQCVFYDNTDGTHETLWKAVSEAARALAGQGRPDVLPAPLEPARHLLASAYVRATLGSSLSALKEVVLEGAILGEITRAGLEGCTRPDLVAALRECFGMSAKETDQIIDAPLRQLVAANLVEEPNGERYLAPQQDDGMARDLAVLVEGVLNRVNLRRAGELTEDPPLKERLTPIVRELIEDTLILRGWDLGAEFAGAVTGIDGRRLIQDLTEDKARNMAVSLREDIAGAISDLLSRPNGEEPRILSMLGRLAFAVDVVLQQGRTVFLHRQALPQQLYLDANVALPLIVEGHPLRPAYLDALRTWRDACIAAGLTPRVFVADVFLEEILANRGLALELCDQMGLSSTERLQKYMLFHGAIRANVFISGYSTFVQRGATTRSFEQWLAEYAPFASSDALRSWLPSHGLTPVSLSLTEDETARYHRIRSALEAAYRADERGQSVGKPTVLINDEARQLARLESDLRLGASAVFVSADRRLRRLCSGPELGYIGAGIISHLALVELVDLLVGVQTDPRSLARLIWGLQKNDARAAIRDYLTDLALERQHEALLMPLPEILDRVTNDALNVLAREQFSLWSRVPEEQARGGRFLDELEDDFFKSMNEALVKYQRDRASQ